MNIDKCPHCGSEKLIYEEIQYLDGTGKIIHICEDCGNNCAVGDKHFEGFNLFCKKAANEAISFFGAANQKTKAVEELAELQKELCKDLTGEGNHENILEEISDVCFMILQLTQIYNFSVDDIIYELSHKIARLQTRMNE